MKRQLETFDFWQKIKLQGDFNESIITEKEEEDVLYKTLYIDGPKTDDGVVRIYLTTASKKGNKGTILIVSDLGMPVDYSALKYVADRGFNAVTFDCSGYGYGSHYTIYPESISFANYKEGKDIIYSVEQDYTKQPWYYYGLDAKYVVKYIKEILQSEKIGVIGVKRAGKLAWLLSSFDEDVDVCCSLFDGGFSHHLKSITSNDENYIEQRDGYLMMYSTTLYMQNINTPFLYLGSTNNNNGCMDKIFECLNRINQPDFRYNFVKNSINTLNNKSLLTLNSFFTKYMNQTDDYVFKKPKLHCEIVGNELVAKLDLDHGVNYTKLALCYCYDEKISTHRNWKEVLFDEEGSLTLKLQDFSRIYMFATATSDNGFTFSSQFKSIDISNVEEKEKYIGGRVIYCNDMGFDTFTVYNTGKPNFSNIFLPIRTLSMEKGPNDIVGIKSNKHALITYKLLSNNFVPKLNNFLRLDIHSPKATTLDVYLIKNLGCLDEKIFSQSVELFGGNIWQKVILMLDNFKSDDGSTLREWQDINAICFDGDSSLLYNNFIWV